MALFRKSTEDSPSVEKQYEEAAALYDSGDFDQAFEKFKACAKKGNPHAQLRLAGMYERGEGTMEDRESALKWYKQCTLPEARFHQSQILINDKGVLKNIEAGISCLRESAQAGCPEAIVELGRMYENGDRVLRNPAEAVRLYRSGADRNDARSQYCLGLMCRNGTGTVRSSEEAVKWFFASAEQGLPEAECMIGDLYSRGEGLKLSPEDAEKWLLRSAEKGYAEGQCQLAWLYHSGVLGNKDGEAVKWYRTAAEQGHASAQNNLGVMYESGRGTSRSPYEAMTWYKRASDNGDPYGQANLGRMYYTGNGTTVDYSLATKYLLMSADKGNLVAMDLLADANREGHGIVQNLDIASKYSRKVSNSINAKAQFATGWLFEKGMQVPRSDEEAAKWYSIAANNGSAPAQCNLGLMYEMGRGVPQSDAEAFNHYLKAANCGNANAQYNVALMYDKGRGVEQSDEEAVKYYTRSADNGNASAQCNLGLMYETGRGVVQSEEEAFRLYNLAIANGNKDAEEYLARLKGEDDEEMGEPVKNIGNEAPAIVNETFSKFHPVPDTGIDFSQVKGLEDVKQEVNNQILQPYNHPDVYRRFRKKVGGGILLYGPPGTGKTMIAQAIATETKAVFFSVKCSDILSRWTGEAVANIKKLFTLARKQPRAVIFFDEFEALGRARADDSRSWEDSLMAEMLSQIQGFDQYDSTLIILAATNRPWDIDPALLRSGRFSRHIYVPLPDRSSRDAIVRSQLDGVPVDPSFDYEDIVEFTEGYNGADVVEFCEQMKQSAINRTIALSSDKECICSTDIGFAKARTKCSVNVENLQRLEDFKDSGF